MDIALRTEHNIDTLISVRSVSTFRLLFRADLILLRVKLKGFYVNSTHPSLLYTTLLLMKVSSLSEALVQSRHVSMSSKTSATGQRPQILLQSFV
jgi:hypothetical protein